MTWSSFTRAEAAALGAAVAGARKLQLITSGPSLVEIAPGAPPRGFGVIGALSSYFTDAGMSVMAGRTFADVDSGVVVLDRRAAGVVAGDTTDPVRAVGKAITMNGNPHLVIGVVTGERGGPGLTAFVPVGAAGRAIPGTRAPSLILIASVIEDVNRLRGEAERWAGARYGPAWKDRVTVSTNRQRVEQIATAMLILKLLMGAVTGISLLVGGIGIMNVLLASVAERTREIGVRKSIGARDRDVLVQFLAESVVITGVGAAAGVALGLGIAFAVAAVMRAKTRAPVYAAVTPSTIIVAASLSVLIGIGFGLYPALRASRLSPIDAIRKE